LSGSRCWLACSFLLRCGLLRCGLLRCGLPRCGLLRCGFGSRFDRQLHLALFADCILRLWVQRQFRSLQESRTCLRGEIALLGRVDRSGVVGRTRCPVSARERFRHASSELCHLRHCCIGGVLRGDGLPGWLHFGLLLHDFRGLDCRKNQGGCTLNDFQALGQKRRVSVVEMNVVGGGIPCV
jgi:hypothetical protein